MIGRIFRMPMDFQYVKGSIGFWTTTTSALCQLESIRYKEIILTKIKNIELQNPKANKDVNTRVWRQTVFHTLF